MLCKRLERQRLANGGKVCLVEPIHSEQPYFADAGLARKLKIAP
jgi:hypothetical protein